jgi:hypothetical protein
MEMARGKRPELFSSKLQQKDKRERWKLTGDTISMLKLLLPREARNDAQDHRQTGAGIQEAAGGCAGGSEQS